jgi:hypothetical protein
MGALNSLATVGLNLAAAQRRQSADADALKAERDRQSRDLLDRAGEERREGRETLRRRLAQERARAGAAGTGGSGGSIDAVLRGLTAESDAQQAAADRATESRLGGLRASYEARRRRSLLDLGTRSIDAGARAASGFDGLLG